MFIFSPERSANQCSYYNFSFQDGYTGISRWSYFCLSFYGCIYSYLSLFDYLLFFCSSFCKFARGRKFNFGVFSGWGKWLSKQIPRTLFAENWKKLPNAFFSNEQVMHTELCLELKAYFSFFWGFFRLRMLNAMNFHTTLNSYDLLALWFYQFWIFLQLFDWFKNKISKLYHML